MNTFTTSGKISESSEESRQNLGPTPAPPAIESAERHSAAIALMAYRQARAATYWLRRLTCGADEHTASVSILLFVADQKIAALAEVIRRTKPEEPR